MKVFVTGHEGHIGHRIWDMLKELPGEYAIVGYDIKSGDDILNYDHLVEKMQGAEVVVHLAGIPHPDKRPLEAYIYQNLLGTANVAKAAYAAGARRMIYASSTAWYGCDINGKLLPDYLPIDEMHPPAAPGRYEGGLKHYPVVKVMAEQVLAYYGSNHMLQTVALRFGPANYKPQQFGEGVFDWRAVPNWDYRRGCMWANVNPDKAAAAIKLAIDSPLEFWYEPFNIVDRYVPEGVSIREFCEQEYPGKLREDFIESDADALITPRKAMEILGYVPSEER